MVEMVCQQCKKPFEVLAKRSKTQKFCSEACFKVSRHCGEIVYAVCSACGQTFSRSKAAMERKRRRSISGNIFCSSKCVRAVITGPRIRPFTDSLPSKPCSFCQAAGLYRNVNGSKFACEVHKFKLSVEMRESAAVWAQSLSSWIQKVEQEEPTFVIGTLGEQRSDIGIKLVAVGASREA